MARRVHVGPHRVDVRRPSEDAMQTTKQMPEAFLGQFDALGMLSQDAAALDAWGGHIPTIQGPISRWWIKKGRPIMTEVATAREVSALSELAFAFETWAPRLA
jgi:hypothetical protein